MDFWWCQWHNHVKFGHNMKLSWVFNLVFRETICDSHSQRVLILPAHCRWHYFGFALSDIPYEQVLLPPHIIHLQLRQYCAQTVSCLSQQQVESLLLAFSCCSKVLSAVGKLCGLTQAQCAVVNRACKEYLAQQWRVIKVNSYLTFRRQDLNPLAPCHHAEFFRAGF